jgi:hypothetical protein
MILEHLQAGHTLTSADAMKFPFCCARLASRVNDLRKDHTILTETIQIKGKRVAQYRYQQ